MRSACQKGNTLTEYSIIAAVVMVLMVGGWITLSGKLGEMIGKERDDMARSARSAQGQQTADASAEANSPGGGAAALPTSIVNLNDANGLTELVQTAGANGATDTLASTLNTWGKQLLAQGKITQDEADLITKLSNQGHDIAEAAAALKEAVISYKTTVTYKGNTIDVETFRSQFGFLDNSGAMGNISDNNTNNLSTNEAMGVMQPYLRTLDLLKQSKAYQNPEIAEQINSASQIIAVLNNSAKINYTTDMAIKGDVNAEIAQTSGTTTSTNGAIGASAQLDLTASAGAAMTVDLPGYLSGKPTSTDIASSTHQQSGIICKTGTGADTGFACVPQ